MFLRPGCLLPFAMTSGTSNPTRKNRSKYKISSARRKKFKHFVKPKASLPQSQQPVSDAYTKSD